MKVDVANGEVVDKITILKIKQNKITNEEQLNNVRKELDSLEASLAKESISIDPKLVAELHDTNLALWDIEDKLRVKEHKQEFDQDFIELARSVYFTNDRRAELKKLINTSTGSDLVEEKHYIKYK